MSRASHAGAPPCVFTVHEVDAVLAQLFPDNTVFASDMTPVEWLAGAAASASIAAGQMAPLALHDLSAQAQHVMEACNEDPALAVLFNTRRDQDPSPQPVSQQLVVAAQAFQSVSVVSDATKLQGASHLGMRERTTAAYYARLKLLPCHWPEA